jgi:AraC-like DNA-binding protein
VFSDEGITIVRLIYDWRLERCRGVLADPAQETRTISGIAFGWEFSDLTRFGRLFGKRFGMPERR